MLLRRFYGLEAYEGFKVANEQFQPVIRQRLVFYPDDSSDAIGYSNRASVDAIGAIFVNFSRRLTAVAPAINGDRATVEAIPIGRGIAYVVVTRLKASNAVGKLRISVTYEDVIQGGGTSHDLNCIHGVDRFRVANRHGNRQRVQIVGRVIAGRYRLAAQLYGLAEGKIRNEDQGRRLRVVVCNVLYFNRRVGLVNRCQEGLFQGVCRGYVIDSMANVGCHLLIVRVRLMGAPRVLASRAGHVHRVDPHRREIYHYQVESAGVFRNELSPYRFVFVQFVLADHRKGTYCGGDYHRRPVHVSVVFRLFGRWVGG